MVAAARSAVLVLMVGGCNFVPLGSGGDVVEDGAPDDADRDAALDAGDPDALSDVDAAVDAAAGCPGNYPALVNGSRYRYSAVLRSVDGARGDCEDDAPGRTHLATFEVAADHDAALDALAAQVPVLPWVGARCGDGLDCALTASWSWDTGAPLDPSLWGPGEPNNGTSERSAVAFTQGSNWKLNNTGAIPGEAHGFVCECDP